MSTRHQAFFRFAETKAQEILARDPFALLVFEWSTPAMMCVWFSS